MKQLPYAMPGPMPAARKKMPTGIPQFYPVTIPVNKNETQALLATLFLAFMVHTLLLFSVIVFFPKVRESDYTFFAEVKLVQATEVQRVEVVKPPEPPPPPPQPKQAPPPPVPQQPRNVPVASQPAGPAPPPKAPVRTAAAVPRAGVPVVASNNATGPAIQVGAGGDPKGVPGGTGTAVGGTGTGGTGTGTGNGAPPPPQEDPSKYATTPYLIWQDSPPMSDGTLAPQIQQWGPYEANKSYYITGEATVYLVVDIGPDGKVVSMRVTNVELGQPDNGQPPDQRKAEAQRYVETVLRPSTWSPPTKNGQPAAFHTDNYAVGISKMLRAQDQPAAGAPAQTQPASNANPLGY
ncbi:MAG: hypothetical protein FJX76_08705 [Armatimonadetes bacterium]|nr:hypothetical protein [Armatimonadota bacterium]